MADIDDEQVGNTSGENPLLNDDEDDEEDSSVRFVPSFEINSPEAVAMVTRSRQDDDEAGDASSIKYPRNFLLQFQNVCAPLTIVCTCVSDGPPIYCHPWSHVRLRSSRTSQKTCRTSKSLRATLVARFAALLRFI